MSEFILAPVLLELAYLGCGLTLCFLGKGLLEKGISGQFQGSGAVASHRFRLVTSSPGLVFTVSGLVIIAVAIVSPARYRISGATPPGGAPLSELAGRTIEGRFAQETRDASVAQLHYDMAIQAGGNGNHRVAATHLASAIVLQPTLLNRALGDPTLSAALADPALAGLIRSRFDLPLDVPTEPQSAPALASYLKVYIVAKGISDAAAADPRTRDLASALSKDREGESAAALLGLLQSDPRGLLRIIEDPKNSWILTSERIVRALRDRIESEMQRPK